MKDEELYKLMGLYPKSILSHAYRLGLKDANVELSKPISELLEQIKSMEEEICKDCHKKGLRLRLDVVVYQEEKVK